MAEKASGAKPIKIADVAKPGKTAPSATSKPVLITHRPIMKDPMVVDADAETTTESNQHTLPSKSIKIQPLTLTAADLEKDETDKAAAEPVAEAATPEPTATADIPETSDTAAGSTAKTAVESASPEASEAPAPSTTTEPDKAEPAAEAALPVADDKPASDEAASDDPNKSTKSAKDKAEADQAAADEKRAAELAELVESRKYYLPINQVEKRKAKRYAWAGALLIILLALAWGDVALDAHLITIPGVRPVTHFFSS